MKKAWSISLLVIGLITIVITVNNFGGDFLPDTLTRILGVIDLLALAVLGYTSVKLKIWKKEK